jgi:hypothetical protein
MYGQSYDRSFYLFEKRVPIVQEAEWAPQPVWKGAENLATTGIHPRTVQSVATCYIDYINPAHHKKSMTNK